VDNLVTGFAQQLVPPQLRLRPDRILVLHGPVDLGDRLVLLPVEIDPADRLARREPHLQVRHRQSALTERDPRDRLQR
jgi:hypothetical protein